jgi:hypothetical protein
LWREWSLTKPRWQPIGGDGITPDGHYTAAYWEERAEEARQRAEHMQHEDARRIMATVADLYERMADRAARREARSQ